MAAFRFPRLRAGRRGTAPRACQAAPQRPGDDVIAAAMPERADCCPAKPQVRVVMLRGPRADFWLCGHHYQASRQALQAAGAVVFDRNGQLIATASR